MNYLRRLMRHGKKTPFHCVTYARYSSDGQREESIEGKPRGCKEYAEQQGMTVITTYVDRATSAIQLERWYKNRDACGIESRFRKHSKQRNPKSRHLFEFVFGREQSSLTFMNYSRLT